MDLHSNLEYLCRVCAANTKGRNSVAECVYILKTAGLKDKLDKFLYLKISENDSLPKVLCKSCFRQVEATASLSKIAKHTQQVFRDFLLSNLPKGPSEITNTAEFKSSDFMGSKTATEKSKKNETVVPLVPPASAAFELPAPAAPTPLMLPPLLQPLTTLSRKDEVVVNVSVADPLTRDNQQKMISNSQRRQSLLLESRFTPKSIAQKPSTTSAAGAKPIAPKHTKPSEITSAINNPTIGASTLSFYPSKVDPNTTLTQTPQTTQIKTLSSGGYVINRVNTAASSKNESKKSALPLKPSADNILQQKRKNLVKALNNINKANNTGQVSLLKSSQQKQVESVIQNTKKVPSGDCDPTTELILPDKLIIAAPKAKSLLEKSKKEPLNLSSKESSATSVPPTSTVLQQPLDQTHNPLLSTPPKSAFPDDILLGRVIRDVDLLKLILKALKWPFNKRNLELQLQRLKSTKFTEIMSDPNLLQDTDLTQLLGPYLAPVLLATQALQQQQQQILKTPLDVQSAHTTFTTPPKMTALEVAQAEINKSIPYKLPPETSVQLVPATPEETEISQTLPPIGGTSSSSLSTLKREKPDTESAEKPAKRQRRNTAQKARDAIIISDEEDGSQAAKNSKHRSAKSTPNIHFDLTSNILAQFNLLNGSCGGNEAEELMALLLKQNAAFAQEKKMQRRRRNSVSNLVALPPSEFDALIDLDDDVVLMEPVSTTTSSSEPSSSNQELHQQQQQQQQQQPQTDATNTFVIPSIPLITRPIIKRRKTVIHPPKNTFDLSLESKSKDQGQISLLKSKEKLMEETINQVAIGIIANVERTPQEAPAAKTSNTETVIVTPTEAPVLKTPQQKKMQSKSSLGQQLLEAIGLQETSAKVTKNLKNEEATISKAIPKPTAVTGGKSSIQQIRTALKRSLQQAQEQEQQKKMESSSSSSSSSSFKKTVIQDADSTTKPGVKEILVVEGKGNKSGNNTSSVVDVEDEIDKVTLMVRKNDKNGCEQQSAAKTNTSAANDRGEKKELKKSTGAKIQERRRTLLASGTKAVGARNTADKEETSHDEEQQEKMEENVDDDADENGKSEKEVSVIMSMAAEVAIPKKRGRKRLIDKPSKPEAVDTEEETETIANIKIEEENESNRTSGRPTRQSKTQSKYYKGPEKIIQNKRSLPSRTARNR